MGFFKSGECIIRRKITQDRESNWTRQNNKRGETGKWESNDSPENPNRGVTSDIPGFPSLGGGGGVEGKGGEVGGEEEGGDSRLSRQNRFSAVYYSHALCSNNFTFVSSNQEAVS